MKRCHRNFIKKILCGFTAAVMLFSLPGAAAAAEDGYYQDAPYSGSVVKTKI